jgi:hypothetical protein
LVPVAVTIGANNRKGNGMSIGCTIVVGIIRTGKEIVPGLALEWLSRDKGEGPLVTEGRRGRKEGRRGCPRTG